MSRAVIVSMGCSKNLVDSERLAAMMAGRGIDVVFDGEPQAGDDVVVNTCGFIGDAKEESIDMLLKAIAQAAGQSRPCVRHGMPQRALSRRACRGNARTRWPLRQIRLERHCRCACRRRNSGQALGTQTVDGSSLYLHKDFGGLQPFLRLLRNSAHHR